MTKTFAELYAVATAAMDCPEAESFHQLAGKYAQADDQALASRRYNSSAEARALLEAVQVHEIFASAGNLTAAERLLTAAIIAYRAVGMAVPTVGENPDGPYRPELAEAFRAGARELCNCDLGDRIEVPAGASVDEAEGGAFVTVRLFVSDEEIDEEPRCYVVHLNQAGRRWTERRYATGAEQAMREAEGDNPGAAAVTAALAIA
jgi:hypothetical protein